MTCMAPDPIATSSVHLEAIRGDTAVTVSSMFSCLVLLGLGLGLSSADYRMEVDA
jgi:hypothetical protein